MNEISLPFSKQYKVLLDGRSGQANRILYTGAPNLLVFSELRRALGRPLEFVAVSEERFGSELASQFETDTVAALGVALDYTEERDLAEVAATIPEMEDCLSAADAAPIIRLLNALLSQAVREGASDIHVETYKTDFVCRFRIDGVLREVLRPIRAIAPLLISRIKVMAKLDIAEKRLPQDGRISIQVAGRVIDLRVSVLPTNHGERVVMRILDKKNMPLSLDRLGLSSDLNQTLSRLIRKPHGIILVTGPTGSGKTTTLYAAMMQIQHEANNIMTVEDPIEYEIAGISQTGVNTKVDMTFAKSLRAILRQDPDVVMIGEIRDTETAKIAVQASLTGHLVFSTLHTNNALGAITRMIDIGVEPFLLSTSLLACLAQRLVRVLCPHCKKADTASANELQVLGFPEEASATLFRAVGCHECHQTGYHGRTGLYELVVIDERMQSLIHDGASEIELTRVSRTRNKSLLDDGFQKVLQGVTTLEEVLRVSSEASDG